MKLSGSRRYGDKPYTDTSEAEGLEEVHKILSTAPIKLDGPHSALTNAWFPPIARVTSMLKWLRGSLLMALAVIDKKQHGAKRAPTCHLPKKFIYDVSIDAKLCIILSLIHI